MVDDYIFRRELDLQTNLPEMIVHLKKDRQFRNMDIVKKKELFDEYYNIVKINFLSKCLSPEEKRRIQNAAMEEMLEGARQKIKNGMH